LRKSAVLGSSLALLAGSTAISVGSAAEAPKKILASAVHVLHQISRQARLKVTDLGEKGPSRGGRATETTADVETPRLFLIETDYDGGPRARFGRLT